MIQEGQPFVKITSPTIDPYIDAWKISVETNLFSDIAAYEVTLVATLDNYPNAIPATVKFTDYISHPCDLTVLEP